MFEFIEAPFFTKAVLYYLTDDEYARLQGQIWMLTVYGKSARENIPAHLLRKLKEAINDGKDD